MKCKFGFKSYASSDSFSVCQEGQFTPASIKQAIEAIEAKKSEQVVK